MTLTKMQKLAALAASVVAVGTALYTGGVALIEDAVASEAQKREEGDLETRIEAIQVELNYLAEKDPQTPSDVARINFLNARLVIYMTRLVELES